MHLIFPDFRVPCVLHDCWYYCTVTVGAVLPLVVVGFVPLLSHIVALIGIFWLMSATSEVSNQRPGSVRVLLPICHCPLPLPPVADRMPFLSAFTSLALVNASAFFCHCCRRCYALSSVSSRCSSCYHVIYDICSAFCMFLVYSREGVGLWCRQSGPCET